jgi:drug/metabolite transporter (DMT)-like permease
MAKGAFYGLLASAIWGGMYVVSDVVLPVVPPFTLLTIRLLLGLLVLSWWVIRGKLLTNIPRNDLLRLIAVGVLGFGISVGAQFVGTDKSTAINGTLITSASPAFIVLFAVLILREPLNLARIVAITLATIGVIVIVDPANIQFGSDTAFGDLALVVAALTWGLYSVMVRVVSKSYDTMIVTWLAFLGGLLVTVPASVVELQSRPVGMIDLPIILGILYLGVISTAGAMWWWNRAFALVPASTASLFFFGQPLVGALLSVLLLGQQMTTNLWIGTTLVIVGVLIALVGLPSRKTND